MQQHPIPQNITGFEFKLVGFLTLKQFSYLATAGVISFILFVATGSFLKWLFIIPIAFFALALTFLPVNGVSFDKWIVLFLRSITSPSKRIWRKEPIQISFLAPQFSRYLRRPAGQPTPTTKYGIESYLAQVKTEKKADRLDALELTKVNMLDFGEEKKMSVIREEPKIAVPSAEPVQTAPEQKPLKSAPHPLKETEHHKKPTSVKEKLEQVKESFSGLAHVEKESK
jgi:hypothetical protein